VSCDDPVTPIKSLPHASVLCDDPVTPIKSQSLSLSTVGATSASSDWFKLSFDPQKNGKGLVCKTVLAQKVINHPFSASNSTAEDFSNEYPHGSPGKKMPLKDLEETQVSK
jgi:hypothetical protein